VDLFILSTWFRVAAAFRVIVDREVLQLPVSHEEKVNNDKSGPSTQFPSTIWSHGRLALD
jgi:hypothetical protein